MMLPIALVLPPLVSCLPTSTGLFMHLVEQSLDQSLSTNPLFPPLVIPLMICMACETLF